MSDQPPNGTAPAAEDEALEPGAHPFWPVHVADQAMIAYVLLGLILLLAVLRPFGLHGQADPLHTPEAIKPEWYFLTVYQLLKYVPKVVGIVMVGLFFAAMLFWPFLDEIISRRMGHRKLSTFVGWAVLVVVVTLMVLGRLSEERIKFGDREVHFDLKAIPHFVTPGEEHQP